MDKYAGASIIIVGLLLFLMAAILALKEGFLYWDGIHKKSSPSTVTAPPGLPITMLTTGYHCPRGAKQKQCDALFNDGLTATMTPVRRGVCAADWRVFPVGTKFYLPRYGYCTVQDSGSRIKLLSIDFYYELNEDAIKHGKRLETVYLIRWGAE